MIPWPYFHVFLAVVTHPRIYRPPAPVEEALRQVEYWMESPSLRLIGESASHFDHLKSMILGGRAAGPALHDARIAAICRATGVTGFWTADRGYSRFPGLLVLNPLASAR